MMAKTFTLNLMGDVMLGRLIDQMFPHHVHEPEEARIARSIMDAQDERPYGPETPWGNTMPFLQQADLNLINLETSVTTHPARWPNKVFNYRMHPANITALKAAKIDYAGLANNHSLDFSEEGLLETVRTVRGAGIAFAGAGESREEAQRPAILRLAGSSREHEVHVWSASDHPSDWATVSNFHLIDYTKQTKERLEALISAPSPTGQAAALKIFSVHWGPNYSWQPADEIRGLAHFLVDECGIDIIHGHSSHHVQGVEIYKGKLIIYGCGDFVDDYALVPKFRNDLSVVWRVSVREKRYGEGLNLEKLEIEPTKIDRFKARKLEAGEEDAKWVRAKVKDLSRELGTRVDPETSSEGAAVVALS